MRLYLVMFLTILSVGSILAQVDTLSVQKLDTVLISASRISVAPERLPAATSVYQSGVDDVSRQQTSLQEYLVQMPGVFTQNATNFAQDLRISIRGFGARAAFGIRGIKLIVDGIPETTPDGQGQLDNLNMGIIKRIEVIKGPSSSLYGNASGGVISIQTIADFEKPFSQWKAGVGSYGFQNYQATAAIGDDKANYIFHGNYGQSNGYRDQSGFQQINTNFTGNFRLSESLKMKALLNYSDSPEAQDPGGLTLEEVLSDRRQARDRNVLFQTGESIRQLKVGTSLVWDQNDHVKLRSYLFYNRRNFEGKLPFEFGGAVDLGRNYIGQGASYELRSSKNTFKVGYDLGYQNDSRRRFRNVEGVLGEKTLDQAEKFTNAGFYVIDHWQSGRWYLTGGLRFDYNKLTVDDNFVSNGDDSGDIQLNTFNPSVGASYAFAKAKHFYANIATSFETPSLSELSADPAGGQGFNERLKPQKAINYEVGLKGKLSNTVQYQVAVFRIDTEDDLVPFELEAFPDRTFFRNAGSTRRNGIEIEGSYAFAKAWSAKIAYAYSDFIYNEFVTGDTDLAGKFLPGIPKHTTSLGLNYSNESGFYANLTANLVGMQYAEDGNDVVIDGYQFVNLRGGYVFEYRNIEVRPYLGINNLLNQKYTDNVRINAFGGRYYEPAPTLNMFGGVVLRI
ncbi:MAG: iron complex outermembrane receptor protein [Flavobacteriales bacterium]